MATLRPTVRGVVAAASTLALLVAEVITGRSGLFLFIGVIGLPLIVAPVLALGRGRRAAAARIGIMVSPPLVPVGAPSQLIIQLANEGDTPLPPLSLERPAGHSRMEMDRGRAITPGHPSLTLAAGPGRLIGWVPLGNHQSGSSILPLPTGRRGVFVIGPLQLWAHDPFGLVAWPVATASPVTLVVHPPPTAAPVPPPARATSSQATLLRGREIDAHNDDPAGEWSGLRSYVPGDRLHLLSWPAEARYGALLVHEFRPDGTAHLRIVLDDRAGVHRRQAFEAALGTIHALVADAAQRACDVDVTTLSGRPGATASTPEGMVEFLTFLASIQPRGVPAGATVAGRLPLDASMVVTTATARPTLPQLPGDPSVVVVE